MNKLETIETPNRLEVLVAKTKFKLDGVRYRNLKTAKWDSYHVY